MTDNVIEAQVRLNSGKGAARTARREGMVPGVVYGGGKDPVTINIPFNALFQRLKAGKFLSTLLTMKIDGKSEQVICRGVQRHVVKDLPTHVDFLRLSEKSRINLFIPVEFINEETCPGLKKGGVLTVVRNEVELKVSANAIPDHLTVDLANSQIGDVIHISDIELPAGATSVITGRNFVIANIGSPSSLRSSDADSAEADAEAGDDEAEADGKE
jgi:large subunit ribosomal protein L25